jgi:outer membrane protein OmpA-like peptidoglycan-associated protein
MALARHHLNIFLLGVLFLGAFFKTAYAELVEPLVYMTAMHTADWAFQGSKYKCELRHEIHKFGIARFQRLAGEDLSFRLDAFQPVPGDAETLLREVSPDWKHETPDPLVQKTNISQGLTPLKLRRGKSSWMLSSLDNGQIPSFDFLDWDDSRKTVHLRLSPVNFQRSYRAFRLCLKALSPDGFDSFRHSVVHYALDVHALDGVAEGRLEALAEYLLEDSSIKGIVIDGHADDQGTHRYNNNLSGRRAKGVYEYLVAAGVDGSLMRRHAHGESRPTIRGRSERARAANRRVEIDLVR